MFKNFYKSISFRLIFYVLIASILMSIGGTSWDLWIEYSRQRDAVSKSVDQIHQTYANSLATAIWDIDETQINIQLRSFISIEDIVYAKIDTGYKVFQMGNEFGLKGGTIKKTFHLNLPQVNPNAPIKTVGTLYVTASLEHVQKRIKEKAIDIFLTETTKVLLLSFFILILSQMMITRHLIKIAEYAKKLNLDHLDSPLYLKRLPWIEPDTDDEFSNMIAAFNEMRVFLKQELYTRQEAEKALKDLNEQLEEKVRQRTTQVEHSNTELKKTLTQLQNAQRQLVENEKMAALGGLVAGIAHEVNTPVGIGVTAASHLKQLTEDVVKLVESKQIKKSDLDTYLQSASEASSILLKNLNRAATIVQSFKQVAVDQTSQEKRLFNVKEYIQEILTSLSPKIKHTKHQIKVDCDPNLSIFSDPGTFSHILTNLIMNALVHAYEPGQAGHISINATLKRDNGQAELIFRFKDDGKGIPEENLPRIFDPFFTTKRGAGGTGLGLHILFNMVTQGLEGSVQCHSTVGQGTEFVIQFPVKVDNKI